MSYDEYGDNPADRLASFGVPADAVRELFQEELAKTMKTSQAIARANQDPYFQANAPAMAAYLETHPDVAQSIARIGAEDPDGALALLSLKYRNETIGAARQRPADPTGYQSGTRMIPMPGLEQEPPQAPPPRVPHPVYGNGDAVQQAREEYRRTGSREAAKNYAKARLRSVISDEFLNQ